MIGSEPQICRGESAFGIPKEAKRQNSLRLFDWVEAGGTRRPGAFPPAADK
jgi:hypothetical protein